MLKKAAIVGGAAATLLAVAPVAHADTVDNDGINILNGNNVSVLPIQACGNDVAVLGAIIPILSSDVTVCEDNGNIFDESELSFED